MESVGEFFTFQRLDSGLARRLAMMEAPVEMPLAVDMDGTLILTDMSVMSAKRVFLRKPWTIFSTIFLELTGKRANGRRILLVSSNLILMNYSTTKHLLTG